MSQTPVRMRAGLIPAGVLIRHLGQTAWFLVCHIIDNADGSILFVSVHANELLRVWRNDNLEVLDAPQQEKSD